MTSVLQIDIIQSDAGCDQDLIRLVSHSVTCSELDCYCTVYRHLKSRYFQSGQRSSPKSSKCLNSLKKQRLQNIMAQWGERSDPASEAEAKCWIYQQISRRLEHQTLRQALQFCQMFSSQSKNKAEAAETHWPWDVSPSLCGRGVDLLRLDDGAAHSVNTRFKCCCCRNTFCVSSPLEEKNAANKQLVSDEATVATLSWYICSREEAGCRYCIIAATATQ